MGICQPYDAADITTPTANPAEEPKPAAEENVEVAVGAPAESEMAR
jgi:hypothetical protein